MSKKVKEWETIDAKLRLEVISHLYEFAETQQIDQSFLDAEYGKGFTAAFRSAVKFLRDREKGGVA